MPLNFKMMKLLKFYLYNLYLDKKLYPSHHVPYLKSMQVFSY
jgi:hypothetical protein